ncbi:single-stranded DNA-binding protein [Rapidithrix thailandica]|uniref:Single-stranded DNA-binding protein n=1 Tax=Rapidithrix thailandica TaxID=413964 RepID=A0AAW9S101_9BACT
MAGVNKVILLGNLGADPEIRHLESGSAVARIRLATTESYKDKTGQRVDVTEWHDVEMWDGLARVAEQYLKKGDSIYVEGKIKSDTWQDDQGNNRKTIRIRALQMTMLPKGGNTGGGHQGNQGGGMQSGNQSSSQVNEDPLGNASSGQEIDDLPF